MKRVASLRRRSMLACLSAISIAGMTASPVAARMTGITGYSGKQGGLYCSNAPGCHSTTSMTRPPLVRFDGPTQVDPGAEVTYHFIVTSQAPELQIQAGFNVAVSDGELATVSGQQERLLRNELTHTGPKDNDPNGEASWEFTWLAPSTPGEYVLFGAGNSVDASTTPDGDQAAITTLLVTVGDAQPSPTPTVTPGAVSCPGDCDGNGTVAVNELISAVNIALGSTSVTACAACDTNRDGIVSIGELVSAVNKALTGC